jgi:hypothetical protein
MSAVAEPPPGNRSRHCRAVNCRPATHTFFALLHLQRALAVIGILALLPAMQADAQSALDPAGRFRAAKPDAGWSFGGTPALTAPGVDRDGDGWLRLTGAVNTASSIALNTGASFNLARGATISFSYAAWGGGTPGGDGISLFLYDATSNMAGSVPGGGLGYCKGAGGWLGLGLDEFGNFSNPKDGCGSGGGPGIAPQALALRGPAPTGNPFLAQAAVPGGIDRPQSAHRPAAGQVMLTILPRPAEAGYLASVDWRADGTGPWARLLDRVPVPYVAPAALRIGVAASTGGARNIHEVRDVGVRMHVPATAAQTFQPAQIGLGGRSTWVLRLGTTNNAAIVLAEPFEHRFPAGVTIADPPRPGGTCPGAVHAPPGSSTLILERGSSIRAGGCTITVDVTSNRVGVATSVVPAFSLITAAGTNLQPSTSTLAVGQDAR